MSLTLHYDFATDKSLVAAVGPTLSITRATTATYFDNAGVMKTAGTGVARFDHLPVSPFTSLGLLVEEARTNICLQSEDFATTWVTTGITVTANAGVAPDGTLTADDLLFTGANTLSQSITVTADTVNTVSIYLKQGTTGSHDWVKVQFKENSAANGYESHFDLSSGTEGTAAELGTGASNFNSGIEDVGNGWYRCWVTAQLPSAQTDGSFRVMNVIADGSATRENTDSVWYWGAQLEAGAFPTSYIPTTTASVTRNVDNISSTDMSWYNTSAGSFYISALQGQTPTTSNVFVVANNNNTTNRVQLSATTNSRAATILRKDSGTQFAATSANNAIASGSVHKVAYAYALADHAHYVDGVVTGTLTDPTNLVPPTSITHLYVGSNGSGGHINGHIAEIRYYNTRLTDTELEDISNGIFPSSGSSNTGNTGPGLTFGMMGKMGA